jgi:hypothetical protein
MTKIEEFIEVMRLGMISNFKTDGFLTPMFFYLQNNQPYLVGLASNFFDSPEGKLELIEFISKTCMKPGVVMSGLISEADIKTIPESDKDFDKYMSGELKISDQVDKNDIIVLIVSTPEKTYSITYPVDKENKKVFDEITSDGEIVSGLFSDFFSWTKN